MSLCGHASPVPGGARLTATIDLRPKGLLRLASPLVARRMQRTEAQIAASFKRVFEETDGRR
jgi:hypothetical protein